MSNEIVAREIAKIKAFCIDNNIPLPVEMEDNEEDCMLLVWSADKYYSTYFVENDGSGYGVYCPRDKVFVKYRSENYQDLEFDLFFEVLSSIT